MDQEVQCLINHGLPVIVIIIIIIVIKQESIDPEVQCPNWMRMGSEEGFTTWNLIVFTVNLIYPGGLQPED
jgi:hypothetical protein